MKIYRFGLGHHNNRMSWYRETVSAERSLVKFLEEVWQMPIGTYSEAKSIFLNRIAMLASVNKKVFREKMQRSKKEHEKLRETLRNDSLKVAAGK